jgi:hypothetical protein
MIAHGVDMGGDASMVMLEWGGKQGASDLAKDIALLQ